MPLTMPFEHHNTISTTEFSLTANSTTLGSNTVDGIYQVWIDAANIASGDEFIVRGLERIKENSPQREFMNVSLIFAQNAPYITPSLILGGGWEFTIRKAAGTDRIITWSIRKIA